MKKWYFPHGVDIEKESVHNARIETFKDNILGSLARETCQNSLDVLVNTEEPVVMEFMEKEISLSEIPDIASFIEKTIPKSRMTWENDLKAQEFLDRYEELLKKESIRILRISDSNTTGLKSGNWESLIEKAGTSFKESIGSAGSFGIGKAAPFASSELRMVFYSTRLENGDEKSMGVTKFVSFDNDDGSTAQGVGYLGEHNKKPIPKQMSFGFKEREVSGTDIYIVGFNQNANWKETIVASLLENFLLSIYQERLVINLEGIIVNKETMGHLVQKLEGKKCYDEIKNYYSVLEDENMRSFLLDERFEKYGFKEEDGVLFLSKNEQANRSVLMTRGIGMKILDRKGISGSIKFNGIFQATGTKFNNLLQEMENPNHNDWIAERYEKDPKTAKGLLLDMYRFMKEKVIENYEEKIEKQVDAFGISDFLPNKLKEDGKENRDQSLNSKIKDIRLKERKNRVGEVESSNEGNMEKTLVRRGIIEGDEGGLGTSKDKDTENKDGEARDGVGDPGGKNKEDESGDKKIVERDKSFVKSDVVSSRVLEKDYKTGNYRLSFASKKNMDKIKLELNLVGETGHGYKSTINTATLNGTNVYLKSNYIVIDNIKKSKSYLVEFQIPYKNRIKMDVKTYEYK